MKQEAFFNIGPMAVLLGCVILVVIITSFIHHLVGRITKWWNPKWSSLVFSVIIGGMAQLRFVEVLEPLHMPVIIGNIALIYLSAVGINAAIGEPIISTAEYEGAKRGSSIENAPIFALKETWRTRWFI